MSPMLRITTAQEDAQCTTLKLEGWVSGDDVAVLAGEIRRCLGPGRTHALDLDGVQTISTSGLDLLQAWAGPGLELRGGSLFVCALLRERGLAGGAD